MTDRELLGRIEDIRAELNRVIEAYFDQSTATLKVRRVLCQRAVTAMTEYNRLFEQAVIRGLIQDSEHVN